MAQDRYTASAPLLRTGIVIFLAFSEVPENGKGDLLTSVCQEMITAFANSVRNFANSDFWQYIPCSGSIDGVSRRRSSKKYR